MVLEGHYDEDADIAWVRLEGYNPELVTAEEVAFGLRELDSASGRLVGLEFWRASGALPRELLQMLGPPTPEREVRR
jgi:uncharacterized protein YuzE